MNPERGFFMPVNLLKTDDFGGARSAGVTLVHDDVRLDAFQRAQLYLIQLLYGPTQHPDA